MAKFIISNLKSGTPLPVLEIEKQDANAVYKEGDLICLCCGQPVAKENVVSSSEICDDADILHSVDVILIYLFYQMEWMKEHGYTLDDLFAQIEANESEGKDAKRDFEESGFNGCLYVCYDEFKNDLLADPEYALTMLSEYSAYTHRAEGGECNE